MQMVEAKRKHAGMDGGLNFEDGCGKAQRAGRGGAKKYVGGVGTVELITQKVQIACG